MMRDLACLPAWYGEAGGYVLVEGKDIEGFFTGLPEEIRPQAICLTREDLETAPVAFPCMEAAPWGMSQQSLHLFGELKRKYLPELEVPEWDGGYRELLNRKTATGCLEEIGQLLPDWEMPATPVFYLSTADVDGFLEKHPGNYVLKAPYSSSGRGLLWLEGGCRMEEKDASRVKGIIRKQGAISLEAALEKVEDFAVEFASDGKGNVRYEGISVFQTNGKGAYNGNLLLPQERLWELLETYTGPGNLRKLLDATTQAVRNLYGWRYAGYLGVDMLIYKVDGKFRIHPCVEVNLRYTMGLVALRLFQRFLDEKAASSFHIIYHPDSAQEWHSSMKNTHPLQLTGGKISKGYLSLCPVARDTHYIACIIAR